MVLHDLLTQAFATPIDLSLPSTSSNKSLPCSFNVNSPTSAGSRVNMTDVTDEMQKQPMTVAPGPPPKACKADRKKGAPMSKNKRLFYNTTELVIQALSGDENTIDSDTSLTQSDNGSAWNDPPSAIFSTHPSSAIHQDRSRVTYTQSEDTQSTPCSISLVQSSLHVNPDANSCPVPRTTASTITTTSIGLSTALTTSLENVNNTSISSLRSFEVYRAELKNVYSAEKKKRMRGRRSGVIRRSARRREPSTKSGMPRR